VHSLKTGSIQAGLNLVARTFQGELHHFQNSYIIVNHQDLLHTYLLSCLA